MISGIVTAQTFYYVSPEGKDKNPGTIKAPFKTIEKAQLKARQTKEDVIICLREGVYRLTETLVFTPQDGLSLIQTLITAIRQPFTMATTENN